MKRLLSLLLVLLLLFTGCSAPEAQNPTQETNPTVSTEVVGSTPDEDSPATNPTVDDNQQPGATNPPAEDNQQPDNTDPPAQENPQPDNTDPPAQENPQPDNTDPPAQENPQPDNTDPPAQENPQPDDTHTHDYQATVTSPTCDKAGYTTYTCAGCKDSYVADQTAALGHDYQATVTKPTCEKDGYTTYACKVCPYTYTANKVAAPGHSWLDATTEAPKTCSTCGTTEGEKLPEVFTGFSDTLYVSYIDVGQGDSIFIKVGDCDILIDAGTANYGKTVSNYLRSQGVDDIELMVNTHPDADHCGGLTQVLNDYAVEEVWISKFTKKSTAAYKNFKNAITSEGLTAKQPDVGTVYTFAHLTLTVIYSAIGSDCNNSSIVIMLEYGSTKFLFTGDAGEEVETKLVNSGVDLRCDVLKVGHHGSKYSSTNAFLRAVQATYGVICVGEGNSYGHPTNEALNRLTAAGVSVYRTDKLGHIVFASNGATLTIPS